MFSVALPKKLVPLASSTEPIGVGFPLPPLTVTVTVVLSVVLMLDGFGETVTVGVICETVTEPVPEALV